MQDRAFEAAAARMDVLSSSATPGPGSNTEEGLRADAEGPRAGIKPGRQLQTLYVHRQGQHWPLPSFLDVAYKVDTKERAKILLDTIAKTSMSSKTRNRIARVIDGKWDSLK